LANESVEIQSEVSGRVVSLNFTEGNIVQKGQLLVKINDTDLQAELRKIEAQIELSEKETKRNEELYNVKGISLEELEISQSELKVLIAEKDVILAKIKKTEITAPFTGKIGLRSISVGAYILTSDIIATLEQIKPLKLEFSVPEEYVNEIKDKQNIDFTVEGNENTYNASIYATESKIDINTRTIKIRATFDNNDLELFPGNFCSVNLNFYPDKESIVIPAKAIIPVLAGETVFLSKNNIATKQIIKTGLRTSDQVEITEGINVGDTVITTGLLKIKEGMTVDLNITN